MERVFCRFDVVVVVVVVVDDRCIDDIDSVFERQYSHSRELRSSDL